MKRQALRGFLSGKPLKFAQDHLGYCDEERL
jgi:hypothetical protein